MGDETSGKTRLVTASSAQIRVAVVDDYDLIVDGLAAMLEKFPDRVEVCDRIIVGEPVRSAVHVALYDTYGRTGWEGQLAAPKPGEGRPGTKTRAVRDTSSDWHFRGTSARLSSLSSTRFDGLP